MVMSSEVLQDSKHRTGRKANTKQADFSETPVHINLNTRRHIERRLLSF